MSEAIVAYLPWLLSAITIWMTLLAGNKTRWAWLIGLGNQALWLTWIVASQSWGLLPMTAALCVVYTRNHLKWTKPASVVRRPVEVLQHSSRNRKVEDAA